MKSFLVVAIFLVSVGLGTRPAFADTFGSCTFDPGTFTLTVTEGPESSADGSHVDCNLFDVGLVQVGDNAFFQLSDAETTQKFPMSDRVDLTNNHVTMISDPRVPDHGLVETPNRITVPEVNLGGGLGFGADLGTGLVALQLGCIENNCFNIPVDLKVISDGSPDTVVPEPGSLMLFGTGLLGMAGFLRRKLHS